MTRAAERFDVVVAGAGLAGSCAAVAAAAQGRKVLLLEKLREPGGSSRLSAGGMAFAGVAPQERSGVQDSPQRLREDLLRMGEGYNDPALVDAYVDNQVATFDWLGTLGVEFTSVTTGSGNSVPRVIRTDTAQVFDVLGRSLDRLGVQRRFGVRVQRLRLDAGKVTGLIVEESGQVHTIEADAVVLATGGFSRDRELVRVFAPAMERATPVGGDGSTGDGLRMACAAGAGLRDMGFVRATFGSHPSARGATNLMLHPIYKGAVMVNRAGQRFVDESRPYKELGDVVLGQPDAIAWQVFDQTVMDQADPRAGTYDFPGALARGFLLQADSLDALAAEIGVDGAQLKSAIEAYNTTVKTGRPDPCGRTQLPAGKKLTAIERAPYYAYPSNCVLLATYCGVTIDAQARVLDAFGAPIPGLFAAGEITGGVHGAGYLSGTSLGKSAIFGRIAGLSAARSRRADTPTPVTL